MPKKNGPAILVGFGRIPGFPRAAAHVKTPNTASIMNDPTTCPTPNVETVSPSFALEYSSPTCPPPEIPEGMFVFQIRAALAGVRGGEHTNVLDVRLNLGEPTRLEFELDSVPAQDQRQSGYRTRGMTVDQLRQWLAHPLVGDGDLTDVAEVEDLGPGWRHFSGGRDSNTRTYFAGGGDSVTGDIAFFAYITATSKAAARKKLLKVTTKGDREALTYKRDGLEICIHINPSNLEVERWDMDD